MKLKLITALTATLFSASVLAQVYQWKDVNGRTVVSDTPPPGSVNSKQTPRTTVQTIAPSAPAAAPAAQASSEGSKSVSERDMEFRKRQQEAKEKAEKAAQEEKQASGTKSDRDE